MNLPQCESVIYLIGTEKDDIPKAKVRCTRFIYHNGDHEILLLCYPNTRTYVTWENLEEE